MLAVLVLAADQLLRLVTWPLAAAWRRDGPAARACACPRYAIVRKKPPQNADPGTTPVPSAHAASSGDVHRTASREFRNLLFRTPHSTQRTPTAEPGFSQ